MRPVTVKLSRISLATLEYFVTSEADEARNQLLAEGYTLIDKSSLNFALHELCDSRAELYMPKYNLEPNIVGSIVVFLGSSACFASVTMEHEWTVTLESVRQQCAERRKLHLNALRHPKKFFGSAAILISRASRWPINLNYIFSYYVIEHTEEISPKEVQIAKILAEPSLIDLDDMLSGDSLAERRDEIQTQNSSMFAMSAKLMNRLDNLKDIDISDNRKVFITWESMLCIENLQNNNKFTEHLLALELRLQMAWNKCFTLSNYADSVFSSKNSPKKSLVEDMYWNLARTMHSTKEIAASTASARINTIFEEMCTTSALHEQIDRLSGKVTLLSQFIQWKRERVNTRYRKLAILCLPSPYWLGYLPLC